MTSLTRSRWLNRRPARFGVVLLLAGLCACAPVLMPPAGERISAQAGRELIAAWQQRSPSSLQGFARAEVDSPGRDFTGELVVLVESPNRLRVESLSPFGLPLLTLVADSRRFAVFIPPENRFYAGTPSADNLQRFTRIPLEPVDLIGRLLGQIPAGSSGRLATYAQPAGGWLIDLLDVSPRLRLSFDGSGNLLGISSFRNGRLLLDVRYLEHGRLLPGFPARYRISVPKLGTTLQIEFTEQRTDRRFAPGLFQLEPPPGVVIQELDGA